MTLHYNHHTFSGGEEHINLVGNPSKASFTHRIESSTDLVKLAMIRDAWDDNYCGQPSVTIPYFPYARQDRVCNKGEAHSLRVVCNMLKAMNFRRITTYDIHSDVAFGILDNLESIKRSSFLGKRMPDKSYPLTEMYDVLIAPDAGALKHCYDDATALGIAEVITATKVRNLKTREIIRTEVGCDYGEITDMKVLITDDICDGGRTFLELAKVLKDEHDVKQVDLFVTHGIFMNGVNYLLKDIDNIYTTDTRSVANDLQCSHLGGRYKVINITGE